MKKEYKDDINTQILKEVVKIDDYYNKYIVPLESRFKPMYGSNPKGVCPFHEDYDPSLSYWKEKEMYMCFGCNAAGDVVKLHQQIQEKYNNNKMTRKQAMVSLAKLYNVELAKDEKGELLEESAFDEARNNQQKITTPKYSIINFEKDQRTVIENTYLSLQQKKSALLDIELTYLVENQ